MLRVVPMHANTIVSSSSHRIAYYFKKFPVSLESPDTHSLLFAVMLLIVPEYTKVLSVSTARY